MKNDRNINDTKATILGVIVIAAVFRAMLFSDADDSLKFLFGTSIILVVCTAIDSILEYLRDKRQYQLRRLRMMQNYYEQMINVERNDPRRSSHQIKTYSQEDINQ